MRTKRRLLIRRWIYAYRTVLSVTHPLSQVSSLTAIAPVRTQKGCIFVSAVLSTERSASLEERTELVDGDGVWL